MKGISSRMSRLALVGALLVAPSLFAFAAHAQDYRIGDLEILHPWSRPTPPNAQVAAGYLTIRNTGTEPDRLIAVSSELSASGEINEMIADEKGVRRKRTLGDGVRINPGNRVTFSPGELHLLFVRLQKPALAGQSFKGALTFEKAGRIEVEFAVEPRQPATAQEIESSGDAFPDTDGVPDTDDRAVTRKLPAQGTSTPGASGG